MELKFDNNLVISGFIRSFNRTAYGIEMVKISAWPLCSNFF